MFRRHACLAKQARIPLLVSSIPTGYRILFGLWETSLSLLKKQNKTKNLQLFFHRFFLSSFLPFFLSFFLSFFLFHSILHSFYLLLLFQLIFLSFFLSFFIFYSFFQPFFIFYFLFIQYFILFILYSFLFLPLFLSFFLSFFLSYPTLLSFSRLFPSHFWALSVRFSILRQHPTRLQLYGHLPPITKTIQVRRTRHGEAGTSS